MAGLTLDHAAEADHRIEAPTVRQLPGREGQFEGTGHPTDDHVRGVNTVVRQGAERTRQQPFRDLGVETRDCDSQPQTAAVEVFLQATVLAVRQGRRRYRRIRCRSDGPSCRASLPGSVR